VVVEEARLSLPGALSLGLENEMVGRSENGTLLNDQAAESTLLFDFTRSPTITEVVPF